LPIKIEREFSRIPLAVRNHLLARVHDREISLDQLHELSEWLKTDPFAPDLKESPRGWYKRFSTFTVCGAGNFCKTFLASGVTAADGFDLDEWVAKTKKAPQKEK